MDSITQTVCRYISDAGGTAYVVGGSTRDMLLGIRAKDVDLEVFGIPGEQLANLLDDLGTIKEAGKSYAVFKCRISGQDFDVSLPRRESKTGDGHKGFTVVGDPYMPLEDAARRRDFTINALYHNPLTGETLDFFNGRHDLESGILRAVAPETFIEDSLRVLRGAQFMARFNLVPTAETIGLCRDLSLNDLSKERIWGEMMKLLLSPDPSLGMLALIMFGALPKLFPEIDALIECPQDPTWHPEGNVFTHTILCLDAAVKLTTDLPVEKKLTVMLAVLCHDLGKPATTVVGDRVTSQGHDEVGVELARNVLTRLNVETLNGYSVKQQVLALVREHLKPALFYSARKVNDTAFRRLAAKVDLDLLARVSQADTLGRGPASTAVPGIWFLARVRTLGLDIGPTKALIFGRDLIARGFPAGKDLGRVLNEVYEAQLDGKVTTIEEALTMAELIR